MLFMKAHEQWANRPDDERFPTLRALYDATKAYADVATQRDVPWGDLRVEAVERDIQLLGRRDNPALLTHWAFGQLASRVGAPASYLRSLPATLAAQNLNHGLKVRAQDGLEDDVARILLHTNGGLLVRALTSKDYVRVWNHEVAERLLFLEGQGWAPAKPTVRANLDPNGYRPPIYASDHDMFVFLAREDRDVVEPGTDMPLLRGVIVENSEVGAAKLRLTKFLYRVMCGNHIVWDAKDVAEFSMRHVGKVRDMMDLWEGVLTEYANEGTDDYVGRIERARKTRIAADKDAVLDKLFGIRRLGLSRKALEASYNAVVPEQDGKADFVWGMVQGITRYSQTLSFADERNEIDRAAGRLLAENF